jgi:hypothetical protein
LPTTEAKINEGWYIARGAFDYFIQIFYPLDQNGHQDFFMKIKIRGNECDFILIVHIKLKCYFKIRIYFVIINVQEFHSLSTGHLSSSDNHAFNPLLFFIQIDG